MVDPQKAQPSIYCISRISIRSILAAIVFTSCAASVSAQTYTAVTDARNSDAYAYALNYEYLMASFYTCAAYGTDIPLALRGGAPGVRGCKAASLSSPYLAMAREFAKEEQEHVAFMRAFLGAGAPDMPSISLDAIYPWWNLAWGGTLNPNVLWWKHDQLFLLAAFIFEDLAVTAYQGEMMQFSDQASVIGIMAVEGYHAGAIRELLIRQAYDTVVYDKMRVTDLTAAISNLRATLSNRRYPNDEGQNDDQNIISEQDGHTTILVPSNGYTFSRTPSQVADVLTGVTSGSARGYFFPNGFAYFNGKTRPAAVQTLLSPLSEADIFSFALNLEFLECIFYTYAVKGTGIGHVGPDPGMIFGVRKANLSPAVLALATEIMEHEYDHVAFFVAKLNSMGVTINCPQLDYTAFAKVMNVAFGTNFPQSFDPFADDASFLIAAYVFEDVGSSAYINAITHLSDRSYLGSGSGIAALESYHAGAIRTLMLFNATQKVEPFNADYVAIATAISSLRAAASHAPDDLPFQLTGGSAQIANADSNGIAFNRSPAQTIAIATLGSTSGVGGFFPAGLNGPINGTYRSTGSYRYLPSGSGVFPSPSPSPTSSPTPRKTCPCTCPGTAPLTPSGRKSSRRATSRRRLLLDL